MGPQPADWAQVVDALGSLRAELARLGERVAALESAAGIRHPAPAPEPSPAPAPATTPPPAPAPAAEGLSEELVLVIAAAVAAFLGKRAHVRQIRLLGSAAWSQQGRVTIQASHALSVHHGPGATGR
jgi:methylmalonyl-CoA carboxyltransferase large subunit